MSLIKRLFSDTAPISVPPAPGIPLYVNECDKKQNVFATYGQYELLKATYAKYDPTRYIISIPCALGPDDALADLTSIISMDQLGCRVPSYRSEDSRNGCFSGWETV
jgi:hypothetical protein